jgi:DNA-binding NarL/FixJ family response regulator
VVQISDDNATRAEDHSRDRALGISTGSSVTAWWTADTVRVVTDFEATKGVRLLSNESEEIIRVAVVDDQRLFTKGISGLVDMLPGVEVVGVAYDGEEAVALCRKEEPDVVLMDISMPKMDGISATREIKDLLPQTAVVILTGHEEDEHVFEGIKAGAQGYLLKDSEPDDLSRAIHTVYAGNTIIAPDLAQKMLTTFEGGRPGGSTHLAAPPLTEREFEVIKALARGMSATGR